MSPSIGKFLILAGLFITVIGVIVYFFYDKLNWIGKLPGDVRIENENFKFYFPITTMVLVSIVASVIIYLFRKYF